MGWLHYDPTPMTVERASEVLAEYADYRFYFDYLEGRVMKVSFETNKLDFRLFDRDNGAGQGERVVRQALGMPAS